MTLSIALVYLLGLISPGPDFVMCIKNSLQYNRIIGQYTAVGFGLGIIVHIVYSFFGITLIIATNKKLYLFIQLLGALYLLYLGISALTSSTVTLKTNQQQNNNHITNLQAIKIGFLTNVLNPKASLFFLSIYTFMQTQHLPLHNTILLSLFFVVATITWFYFVATLITHQQFQLKIIKYNSYINKLLGFILLLISGKILYSIIMNFV